jgi:hypothetical protein
MSFTKLLLLPIAAVGFVVPNAQGDTPPIDHYYGLPPGVQLTPAEQAVINADLARGDTFETWISFGRTSDGGTLETRIP